MTYLGIPQEEIGMFQRDAQDDIQENTDSMEEKLESLKELHDAEVKYGIHVPTINHVCCDGECNHYDCCGHADKNHCNLCGKEFRLPNETKSI